MVGPPNNEKITILAPPLHSLRQVQLGRRVFLSIEEVTAAAFTVRSAEEGSVSSIFPHRR